jgi:phosphoglycerate kinase
MNLHKQTIDDMALSGKRVIIRADFNVPLDDSLQITDDTRIRSTLPTINRVVDDGGKAILCSHLGRPKGKFDPKFSLAPIAKRLGRLLGKEVIFAPDCIGHTVESLVAKMKLGDVMLLENLRFHDGEEKNDEAFCKSLAALGDVYINDAFGAAHRAHASTVGITKFIPASAAGFLLKKEIEYLEGAVENPVRPFVAILGGAKVSGKIGVIENLGKRVDKVIIGGCMAFTFLKAKGLEIGNSLVENDMLDFAKGIGPCLLTRCEILSAGGLRRGRQPRAGRGNQDRARSGNPQRMVRARHRPSLGQALQRSGSKRQNHPLERPDGYV